MCRMIAKNPYFHKIQNLNYRAMLQNMHLYDAKYVLL